MTRRVMIIGLLGILLSLNSGCSTIMVRSGRVSGPPTLYPATKECFSWGILPLISHQHDCVGIARSMAILYLPVTLIDLPISLITDTACIPMDTYSILRYDKDIEFWNAFLHGPVDNLSTKSMLKHKTKHTTFYLGERLRRVKLEDRQRELLIAAHMCLDELARHKDLNSSDATQLYEHTKNDDSKHSSRIQITRNLVGNEKTPAHIIMDIVNQAPGDTTLVYIAKYLSFNDQAPRDAFLVMQNKLEQCLAQKKMDKYTYEMRMGKQAQKRITERLNSEQGS